MTDKRIAVQAVIFDWAGTVVDFGSRAPAGVFVEVFRRHGVAISMAEARGPMGSEKRAHVAELLAVPAIAERFRAAHGHAPGDADVERIYRDFIPLQLEVLADYAELIPGTADTAAWLRRRGVKIAGNTGYDSAMSAVNERLAAPQGYAPDVCVAASDVKRGRPAPDMALKCALELGVDSVRRCVKVDDTIPGILEGLNAGMWTVGVTVSGNEVGLSAAEWDVVPVAEQDSLRAAATRRLAQAGAHYVIDSVADLPAVIETIERRLAAGDRP
jgi:phosphonoacetaldehyde hydrolase